MTRRCNNRNNDSRPVVTLQTTENKGCNNVTTEKQKTGPDPTLISSKSVDTLLQPSVFNDLARPGLIQPLLQPGFSCVSAVTPLLRPLFAGGYEFHEALIDRAPEGAV